MNPALAIDRLTQCRSRLLLLIVLCAPAFAQSPEPVATTGEGVAEPDERAIDEITVVAPRTITAIKAAITKADRKMYALFNDMNQDRRYDVSCTLENRYGSNMKTRVCRPQFERDVLDEAFRDNSTWTSFDRPEAELRRYREEFRQKMIDFAATNPELQQAVFERARLQRDLKQAEDLQRQARREE